MNRPELKLGLNRTPVQLSPDDTKKQIEATQQYPADVPGSIEQLTQERHEAIDQADNVGSVPIPGSLKGMVKTALDKLRGKNPEVLVDKLGERLAFERTGVRMYEAMIAKAVADKGSDSVLVDTLRQIQQEEDEHMAVLRKAIETLGGDPTAMTPCADVVAVKSQGVMQVLTDPRTTTSQCLSAILTLELEDNDAWAMLIELTRKAGHPMIASDFERALREEEEHLSAIRTILKENVLAQVD